MDMKRYGPLPILILLVFLIMGDFFLNHKIFSIFVLILTKS
mgnify:CR=1 FL=1